MDIPALKGSHVGESEQNVRTATKIVDAFGGSVLWWDEIEKALAGSRSSGDTDGGVSAGILGHLLNWMQETPTPVFIVATANNISQLPPELIRRFDDVFFVDAPTHEEREAILNIMNARYPAAKLPLTPGFVSSLEGYTGSEIEKIARASIFDGLDSAMTNTIPLFRTMKEELQWLREWAQTKARKANKTIEATVTTRRVNLGN
jgi:SpoVK/Ycf46/Vps4 family AAA+-type ATPase